MAPAPRLRLHRAFAVAQSLRGNRCYLTGLCFFGAWLIPTTYWYFAFMPWWLAPLASMGFVALIANVFRIFELRSLDRLPLAAVLGLVVVAWSG